MPLAIEPPVVATVKLSFHPAITHLFINSVLRCYFLFITSRKSYATHAADSFHAKNKFQNTIKT